MTHTAALSATFEGKSVSMATFEGTSSNELMEWMRGQMVLGYMVCARNQFATKEEAITWAACRMGCKLEFE